MQRVVRAVKLYGIITGFLNCKLYFAAFDLRDNPGRNRAYHRFFKFIGRRYCEFKALFVCKKRFPFVQAVVVFPARDG